MVQPAQMQLYPLFVVADAAYNGADLRSKCLDGTRERVIAKIMYWKCHRRDRPICWVQGPPGLGKSAVAQTIAELCAQDNTLAASFFFRRSSRNEFRHFITTIAFQLTLSIPALKPAISKLLQADPTVLFQRPRDQFEKLIVKPILAVSEDIHGPMVIVIDALDECKGLNYVQNFITILAHTFIAHQLPLQFLVTSRAETGIQQRFSEPQVRRVVYEMDLAEYNAQSDIHAFLSSRFLEVCNQHPHLMRDTLHKWPSDDQLSEIVTKSEGNFLYASTLVEFVTDSKGAPQHRLAYILSTFHVGLDPLYIQILRSAPSIDHLEQILPTIILARVQPSIDILADLLELDALAVVHALMQIRSLIKVPSDNATAVRPNHASLSDFLTDIDRSGAFYVDPRSKHMDIAFSCLQFMIRALDSADLTNTPAQLYACSNWAHHLNSAITGNRRPAEVTEACIVDADAIDARIIDILDSFFTSHALEVWINHVILDDMDGKTSGDLIISTMVNNLMRDNIARASMFSFLTSLLASLFFKAPIDLIAQLTCRNVDRLRMSSWRDCVESQRNIRRKHKALLIGIKQSIGEVGLSSPHKDVLSMRDLLMNIYGYKQEDITIMLDDNALADPHMIPTRQNIIGVLVDNARAGDRFVFHCKYTVSGHSRQVPNLEDDDMNEAVISVDGIEIVDKDLRKYLVDTLPAGIHLVAIFDTVYSSSLLAVDLTHHRCNNGGPKKQVLWAPLSPMPVRRSTLPGSSGSVPKPPVHKRTISRETTLEILAPTMTDPARMIMRIGSSSPDTSAQMERCRDFEFPTQKTRGGRLSFILKAASVEGEERDTRWLRDEERERMQSISPERAEPPPVCEGGKLCEAARAAAEVLVETLANNPLMPLEELVRIVSDETHKNMKMHQDWEELKKRSPTDAAAQAVEQDFSQESQDVQLASHWKLDMSMPFLM
ncbi:hypothetical protein HWV62_15050 [Athelia sp. TMB]|nr:hypothetical protein HWV62_15050 [Athelia sp. TMB]